MRKFIIKSEQAKPSVINYRDVLNAEQRAVVMAGKGPLLVIAGAGSGKTRTATYRVARLIEAGVAPGRILLVTFTNRAAREMLGRVETLLHAETRRVWGGTFHSLGNRILRRHAASLGYESNFSILDAEDAKDMVETCIEEAAIDTRARRFPKGEVLSGLFSYATNTDTPLEQLIAAKYPQFEPLTMQIVRVDRLYQARKLERNAMDYDDLLVNWKRLLVEKPDIAAIYQEQFEYVLVDEYQDTNKLQAEIVDLLAAKHRNLMVVGDDAQSIFGWRGANFANIFEFKDRYPDAQVFKLETNYRSSPEILMLANASVGQNRKQFPKNLQAVRPSRGFTPALVAARDAEQQAAFVAARILELRDEGVPLDEMAVLYRSHFHSLELQLELTRRGIPYDVRSGVRFFEQAHIKDVVAYLRLLVNPRDELAWKRVLKLIPKIGNATAARVWEKLAYVAEPLALVRTNELAGALPKGAQSGWGEFVELIKSLLEPDVVNQPAKQIELVLARGYLEYLQALYENAEAREEDLRQLANFAASYETTETFLSELALINTERFAPPGGTAGVDVLMGGDEDEELALSSVHQAKGLEWRVVFVLWAADGRFPSARSLRDAEGEEEERRLFYVALTRARDELYVCYPLMESERGRQSVIQRPSRFVTEVPRELFEIWSVDEELPKLEEMETPKLLN
ncbi:MAG: ATP-dependent helicase [Acidobacteria bacterium]|nr:ATP-dependent helicase [Acidobacteriota bacterium]MBI3427738.1 ATP-dependent helicase [Acidobacteriota bacterium]